jgi:hypothetical protein
LAGATNHVLMGFANCKLSTFAGLASRPLSSPVVLSAAA